MIRQERVDPKHLTSTVAILAIAAASCGSSQDLPAQDIDRPARCESLRGAVGVASMDSSGVKIIASATPAWSAAAHIRVAAAPAVAIGLHDGNPAYEFGTVTTAVLMSDGRIVVADAQAAELKVYDSSGRHLGTFGRSGSGPGEYRVISALYRTRGDTLLVVDPRNQRITRLLPSMETLGAITLEPIPWVHAPGTPGGQPLRGFVALQVKGVLDDGSLLATHTTRAVRTPDVTTVSRDTLQLRLLNPATGAVDSVGMVVSGQWFQFFPGDGSFTFGQPPWGYVESLAVARDRYYYGTGENFQIEERTPHGRLVRLIRVCDEPTAIDARRINQLIERYLTELRPELVRSQEVALKSIPHPVVAPSYLRLLADRVDRLWVQQYTAPGEKEVWRVLDREGRWLANVQLPDGSSLLDAGRDYILIRHTDALDVETVRMHRLNVGDQRDGSQ